jgi:hypothetical protein
MEQQAGLVRQLLERRNAYWETRNQLLLAAAAWIARPRVLSAIDAHLRRRRLMGR